MDFKFHELSFLLYHFLCGNPGFKTLKSRVMFLADTFGEIETSGLDFGYQIR